MPLSRGSKLGVGSKDAPSHGGPIIATKFQGLGPGGALEREKLRF